MSPDFKQLTLEGKKVISAVPAIVSYFFIAVLVSKFLILVFDWSNTTYVITTFLPGLVKSVEGFGKSTFSATFMGWWGSLPLHFHWIICDVVIYYFFAKAYLPNASKIWEQIKVIKII